MVKIQFSTVSCLFLYNDDCIRNYTQYCFIDMHDHCEQNLFFFLYCPLFSYVYFLSGSSFFHLFFLFFLFAFFVFFLFRKKLTQKKFSNSSLDSNSICHKDLLFRCIIIIQNCVRHCRIIRIEKFNTDITSKRSFIDDQSNDE